MQQNQSKVELTVEAVKESAAGGSANEPSVVLETESTVDGRLRDASIEVREVDAPEIAAALLNAELTAPADAADLPAAVRCLAAGLVHGATEGQVRLHLQFESGQVLPIEMPRAAAVALARVLSVYTDLA